ncbi:unnamed protein product [Closterium sp. NIES-54]
MADFTALPFQLANASFTIIVEMSQRCSGSACMSGSSSSSSSSSSASSYTVVKAAGTKKSGGLKSWPVRCGPDWIPRRPLHRHRHRFHQRPADFSPAAGSPADRPVADCFLIGFAAACSPVGCCPAGASFAEFTKGSCTSLACCSPVGVSFTPTPTLTASRWPAVMLLAGATVDATLLPSSPNSAHVGHRQGAGQAQGREGGHLWSPYQQSHRPRRAEGASSSRSPSAG